MDRPNNQNKNIHLVLFFTRGVSLQSWDRIGVLKREVALYQTLQAKGIHVSFITYGNKRDLKYRKIIPGIDIYCNRWWLPSNLYQNLLLFIHRKPLKSCDIVKTNQTDGGLIALSAAKKWDKPLIARCGYMWSEFVRRQLGEDDPYLKETEGIEEELFCSASQVVVTTQTMADDISKRIPAAANHVRVIPNYVENTFFSPSVQNSSKKYDLIFVGRLSPQKNIDALLEAITPLNISLLLIGQGELEGTLKEKFSHLWGKVTWINRVPHDQLPDFFHLAKAYILPSHYEGHPKTLIEAMACGMPVIGADVEGIQNLINHKENGWLCGTDPESIRSAIETVLADNDLQTRIGNGAFSFAQTNYALEHIVKQELALYEELLRKE
ncbi:MAG: glycosyltransferase family 4 protein [Anaerolineales bacterium]|nr:glycosyltransferase family 4 protein [Anaerolineales bacterium]